MPEDIMDTASKTRAEIMENFEVGNPDDPELNYIMQLAILDVLADIRDIIKSKHNANNNH